MPQTINGTGTWYLGRRRKLARPGRCEHCGREGELVSYDTRLWITFGFVPIVPLGRKRVIDECRRCRRHRAMAMRAWQRAAGEARERGVELVRSRPGDPEPALELLATLLAFGEIESAKDLAAAIGQRFRQDARVLAGVARALSSAGLAAESREPAARALALDPDEPHARVVVGLEHVERGHLDEARELLAFLAEPDCTEDARPLAPLATALVGAGRPAEALALYQVLARRAPELAQDRAFRRDALRARKRAGGELALPRRRGAWKAPTVATIGAALALLFVFIGFVEPARHRRLWVTNGFELPLSVAVRGGPSAEVLPGRVRSLELAEGDYVVDVEGAIERTYAVALHTPALSRLRNEPAFVLNPGGAALLELTEVDYARDASGAASGRLGRILFGDEQFELEHLDDPFQAPPQQMYVDARLESVSRKHLDLYPGSRLDAVWQTWERDGEGRAMELAEACLRLHREDEELLAGYIDAAAAPRLTERARAFLLAGATLEPMSEPWHAAFVALELRCGADPTPRYDSWLAERGESAALLTLRANLAPTAGEARAMYERALDLDPLHARTHLALGRLAVGALNWPTALAELGRARELDPRIDCDEELVLARMAAGDPELEGELRRRIAARPGDAGPWMMLGELLFERGERERANETLLAAERALGKRDDGSILGLRARFAFCAGDLEACRALLFAYEDEGAALDARLLALEDGGEVDEAALLQRSEWQTFLAAALAEELRGAHTVAARWRTSAQELMRTGDPAARRLAELLGRFEEPTQAELEELRLDLSSKALLFAELAHRWPHRRAELAARARAHDVGLRHNHYLIERALAE